MLTESFICFAIKDDRGKYIVNKISIFKLKQLTLNLTSVNSIKFVQGDMILNIKCPLCSEIHSYKYSLKDVLKPNALIIGGCEKIGNPIFCIGEQSKIEKKISIYNYINRNVYAIF